MIIKCEDGTSIENLKPNSRKKIIFKCDNCGKEASRVYKNYYNNDINLCRNCIAKKVNNDPEIKKKNSEKQKKRWESIDRKNIGKKISKSQKKSWENGRRGKGKSLSYDEVKESFKNEGYILLTTEYEYNNAFYTKFKYTCPVGHMGYTDYNHWFIRGQRCGKCSKNAPLSYYNIKASFEERGYELITTKKDFKGTKENLKYKCPYGHTGTITWTHWTRGHGCSKCAKNQKITYDVIKKAIELENHILVDEEVGNSKQSFKVKCPFGHIFETCWNYWNSGHRCPQCVAESSSSIGEREVADYIKELGFEVTRNNRSVLKDLELDILIKSKNMAIEYCGIYWHSETYKDKKYHLNKLNRCLQNRINLITIFEDEWEYKKDIVKSRLKHILSKYDKKIYARKCFIKEIDSKTAEKFCSQYHLQGYQASKIKVGLFYNKELVSIMTFGKQSIAKGNKDFDSDIWEIIRFCSKYNVIGAAGKLLTHFKNNYSWSKIITFADRRWSNGGLYKKLNFSFVGYTKPSYWYINMNTSNKIREHRFKYRKDKISHLGEGTEWEIMQSLDYTRIWDCGHMKFEMANTF